MNHDIISFEDMRSMTK